MALKLQPNPTFKTPVQISVPGSEKPAIVDFVFKHKTKEKLAEFIKSFKEDEPDEAYLSEIIEGWDGVDADYSVSALRGLISNYPASALEILRAYVAALSESRRKN
jgi:hypothetical protein